MSYLPLPLSVCTGRYPVRLMVMSYIARQWLYTKQRVTISIRSLASLCNLSPSSVQRAVASLIRDGWLIRVEQGNSIASASYLPAWSGRPWVPNLPMYGGKGIIVHWINISVIDKWIASVSRRLTDLLCAAIRPASRRAEDPASRRDATDFFLSQLRWRRPRDAYRLRFLQFCVRDDGDALYVIADDEQTYQWLQQYLSSVLLDIAHVYARIYASGRLPIYLLRHANR